MNDLNELYQQLIIDHSRSPRNFGELSGANRIHEGYNPVCGDRLTLYIRMTGDVVEQVRFQGGGCAISMASASLMTEMLLGKRRGELKALFSEFQQLVTGKIDSSKRLGKLMVLGGVADYPARVKCATLCWHTMIAAMKDHSDDLPVSTE